MAPNHRGVTPHEHGHGARAEPTQRDGSASARNPPGRRDDSVSEYPADRLSRRALDRIASAAAMLLDVPLVLVSVFDGPRQTYVGTHGLAEARAKESSGLCREVAVAGRPIVMQDARRRLPAAARGAWGFELVAYAGVALPLLGPTRIGTLAALTPARRAWQSRDLHVLRCLADAAAAILDTRAACNELVADERRGATHRAAITSADGRRRTLELEQTSVHDELTGLLNRRGLFAIGAAQLEAVRRHARSGFLLYVDLDGLKTTNDRHGHAAGDELLRAAASVLRAAFREADTIARLGGDEFVVIATDAPRDEQPAILARLATELARANERRAPATPLAWSLGLVAIDPAAPDGLDKLMSAADRRMYSAKRALHELVAARGA